MTSPIPAIQDALERIIPALREEYPRGAHKARIEQIETHIATLQSLVSQLGDEEDRESDYEQRLLGMHEAGKISMDPGLDPLNPDNHPQLVHPQGAFERLAEALPARDGS